MFNRETHKSRGFGFIVFELEKGAELVCAEKEHSIDGKVVRTHHLFLHLHEQFFCSYFYFYLNLFVRVENFEYLFF